MLPLPATTPLPAHGRAAPTGWEPSLPPGPRQQRRGGTWPGSANGLGAVPAAGTPATTPWRHVAGPAVRPGGRPTTDSAPPKRRARGAQGRGDDGARPRPPSRRARFVNVRVPLVEYYYRYRVLIALKSRCKFIISLQLNVQLNGGLFHFGGRNGALRLCYGRPAPWSGTAPTS